MPETSTKTKYKSYALLLVIGLISLAIRVWLLDTRWINPDEGAHMMDAVLIMDGAIPSVDFASRQPVYAYSIAAAFKVLGVGYVPGRILPMLLSLLVALPIFFMARLFYNETVAFIATAIYLMLPLELLNSVVVKTEPLSMMMMSLSFLMLAKFSRQEVDPWLLPAGVLAALGFYVRQSALIIPAAAVAFLVLYGSGGMAAKIRRLFWFLGGYALVVGFIFIFYSRHLAFSDIWNGNLNPLFFVLESFKKVFQLVGMAPQQAGSTASLPIEIAGQAPYALYYRYISQAFKMHLFLIVGAVFSMCWGSYRAVVQKDRRLTIQSGMLPYLWLILLALAYIYYFRARGFYIDYFREFFPPLVILFAVWLVRVYPGLEKGNNAGGFVLVAGGGGAVLFLFISRFKGAIPTKGVVLLFFWCCWQAFNSSDGSATVSKQRRWRVFWVRRWSWRYWVTTWSTWPTGCT